MEHRLGMETVARFRRFLARETDAKGRLVFQECPNLGDGGCLVHEFRPLSCRLYGHFRAESADFFEHCVFRGGETVFADDKEHLLSPGQIELTELNLEYLTYFPSSSSQGADSPFREPQTELELASHLAMRGDYCEAAEILRRLRGEQDSADLIWMLAGCYTSMLDYANATLILDEGIARSPRNPELHFQKGCNLLWAGCLSQARMAFEDSLALAPDGRNAHGLLGLVCRLSGDTASARHHLSRAVHLESEPGPYRLQFGLVLASLGELEEARRLIVLAQDYEPTREQARQALSKL